MTDINKVEGPSGAPESLSKKNNSPIDDEKFRQEMQKKVTKVKSIDPDEKKKRKQRGEEEEEEGVAAQPAAPPESTPPSSPTLDAGEKNTKVGASESKTPPRSSSPSSPTKGSLSSMPSKTEPITNDPKKAGKTEPKAAPPKTPDQAEEKPTAKSPQAETKVPTLPTPKSDQITAQPPKRGIQAAELETTEAPKEEDRAALLKKERVENLKENDQDKLAAEEGTTAAPQNIISEEPAEKEPPQKKTTASSTQMELAALPMGMLSQISPRPTVGPEILPSYAALPPQVQAIFDRMVGVVTVMTQLGMTETTFTLNAPEFSSSPFFGAQIVIQEFSTAPNAFNIQLVGNNQAVALFQGNVQNLMASFQSGGYNFRINRIETAYLAEKIEKPLFRRKESSEGNDQEQRGESDQ